VFNDNDTWSTSDDDYRRLTSGKGSGGLPSNEVYCLAEDDDGQIWVGTNQGVAVFYSPENIFNSNAQDAEQIYITQDGNTQLLLETELIQCITIDGANRKWIGTETGGVFLMSADGKEQLAHFTALNSPLPSNNVSSISINGLTGEVFIGTDIGLVSYKGTATEGLEQFTDVYAYPNPVRSGYTGTIAIKGLVKNCDVKITDMNGTVVYQTTALGGQAIWDGNNFEGKRANSGIYLVFMANEDGTQKHVAKICFIN
jgi:Two component regulator propeller